MLSFPGFFFLVALCIACNKPVDSTKKKRGNIEYNSVIELYHCADTINNNSTLRICFDSLYDHRCPLYMECFWAGEATVKLSLQSDGHQQSFKLSTLNAPPAFRSDTTILGYRIKLLSVSPYPGDNSQQPYRAAVSVTR